MHIVIIGNGIAGITAARTIRKHSDHAITVISGETDYFFSFTKAEEFHVKINDEIV